jgi:hypothetical protein
MGFVRWKSRIIYFHKIMCECAKLLLCKTDHEIRKLSLANPNYQSIFYLQWELWGRSVDVVDEAMVDLRRLCVVRHPTTVNDVLVRNLVLPWN